MLLRNKMSLDRGGFRFWISCRWWLWISNMNNIYAILVHNDGDLWLEFSCVFLRCNLRLGMHHHRCMRSLGNHLTYIVLKENSHSNFVTWVNCYEKKRWVWTEEVLGSGLAAGDGDTISQFHNSMASNKFFLLYDFSYNLVCMMMMGCWSFSCVLWCNLRLEVMHMFVREFLTFILVKIKFSLQPRKLGKMLLRRTMSVDRGGIRFWISCRWWWNLKRFYGFPICFCSFPCHLCGHFSFSYPVFMLIRNQ